MHYAFWDVFKALPEMQLHRAANSAKLLAQLVCSGAVPISVLKVVHWSAPSKRGVFFWQVQRSAPTALLALHHRPLCAAPPPTRAHTAGREGGWPSQTRRAHAGWRVHLGRTQPPPSPARPPRHGHAPSACRGKGCGLVAQTVPL